MICLKTFSNGSLEEKGRSRHGLGAVIEPANRQSHLMGISWRLYSVIGGALGMMLAVKYSKNTSQCINEKNVLDMLLV